MVAISQAPSPESNPNSPSPVKTMVGLYPTIKLIGQKFECTIASTKANAIRLVIMNHHCLFVCFVFIRLFTAVLFIRSVPFVRSFVYSQPASERFCLFVYSHFVFLYIRVFSLINTIFFHQRWNQIFSHVLALDLLQLSK